MPIRGCTAARSRTASMRSRAKPSSATARSAGDEEIDPCRLCSRPVPRKTARDDIAVYTFGKHVIRHQFCKTCGCAPFAERTGPEGEAMVAVNLRCAENLDLSRVKITPFDGASLWRRRHPGKGGRS